jgi:Glycosyl hydrolase catalytic core
MPRLGLMFAAGALLAAGCGSSVGSSVGAGGSGGSGTASGGSGGVTSAIGGSGETGGVPGSGGIAPGGRAGAGGRPATGGSGGAASATGGSGGAGSEPFKGVANSPCAARKLQNVSWYYNWEQTEDEPCSDGGGGQFVPMVWGHTGGEQSASGISSAVASFVGKHQAYVMGFNEPDNSSQSNISVATAISLWPSFLNASIQVISPATQANSTGMSWFSSFIKQADQGSLRIDVVGAHWYGWNAGSCESNAATLESYLKWLEGQTGDRPIWLTEWGCLHDSAPDAQTVITFFKGAVAMFAKHPRLRRYAWYPWSTNLDLNNSDGSLTDLGKVFAAEPAYH